MRTKQLHARQSAGAGDFWKGEQMEELIKRLERVIQTGAPNKDGMHPISAEVVLEVVKQLPPANSSEIPNNSDAIYRQAAITAIDNCGCDGEDSCGEPWIYKENAVEAIEMVEPLPTAPPEIICCKDCKHWIPYDWMFSEEWQSRNIDDYPEDEIGCNLSDMAMKANDFCSRGERRTDG